jgi:exopolysaccharide production protein ExoZ
MRVALFSALACGLATYVFFRAGPIRLVMFVAGIVLFETIKGRRFAPPRTSVALFAVVVAFGATLIPTLGSTGYMWKTMLLFVAFYALCFACFERPGSALTHAVSATPLRWLGNMSYSYYLLHGLALKIAFAVLDRLFPPTPAGPVTGVVLLLLMFVVTLPPTLALFLFVEYPLSLSPRRPWRAPNAIEAAALATQSTNVTPGR